MGMPVDYEDLGYPDEWPATTEIGKSEAPTNCPDCSILRAEVARLKLRPENAHIAGLEYKAAQLHAEVERLTAERDAALARIEKTREVLEEKCPRDPEAIYAVVEWRSSQRQRALAALTEVPT